jgi:hypothetical protein
MPIRALLLVMCLGPRVPRLALPLYFGAVLIGFGLLFPFKTW